MEVGSPPCPTAAPRLLHFTGAGLGDGWGDQGRVPSSSGSIGRRRSPPARLGWGRGTDQDRARPLLPCWHQARLVTGTKRNHLVQQGQQVWPVRPWRPGQEEGGPPSRLIPECPHLHLFPPTTQEGPAGLRRDQPGAGGTGRAVCLACLQSHLGGPVPGPGRRLDLVHSPATPPGTGLGAVSAQIRRPGLPPGPGRRQPRCPQPPCLCPWGQSFSKSLALGPAPGELLAGPHVGPHAGQHQGAGAGQGVRGRGRKHRPASAPPARTRGASVSRRPEGSGPAAQAPTGRQDGVMRPHTPAAVLPSPTPTQLHTQERAVTQPPRPHSGHTRASG